MGAVYKETYNIEITLNKTEKEMVEKALELTAQKHYSKEIENNKQEIYADYLINQIIKYKFKNAIAKNKLYNIFLHTFEISILLFALYYYGMNLNEKSKIVLEKIVHIILCESGYAEKESREFLKLPEKIKLDFYINNVLRNLV